jgi:hypothetical protein
VLFREHGESEWHRGSTLNISRLGVLVRTDGPLPGPGDAVDFILTLSLNEMAPASQVCCAGHVVRIAPEELAGGGRAVAMTIDSYAFESLRA